jgi:hypothetical protein
MREKSQPAVAAARFLASRAPAVRSVALEQAWAYGEKLYLGNDFVITDVPSRKPLDPSRVAADARGRDAAALYAADASPEIDRALRELGFGERRDFDGDGPAVVVFLRGAAPQSGQ